MFTDVLPAPWMIGPVSFEGAPPMKMKPGMMAAVAISVFLLVAGIAVAITAQISSYECERKAVQHATPYTWDLVEGCYIEEDGKWVPANSL